MLIAEIALDMKDLAELAGCDDTLDLAHAWKAALVVAERERNAGLCAGTDRAFGLGARQCQGLFAPDRLAGRRDGGNLPNVQRMRSCKKHRLHARIGNCVFEFSRELEALGYRKFTRKLRLFGDATDDPQASAFALYGFDNIFSPSAKTDDSSIDHGRVEEFILEDVMGAHSTSRCANSNPSNDEQGKVGHGRSGAF